MFKKITFITVFLVTLCSFGNASEKIDVIVKDINNIDVSLGKDGVTVVELEREVQGIQNLSQKYLSAVKLSSKLVLLSIRADYVPNEIGKLVLTDSACNVYVLNIFKKEDKKDRSLYIKNGSTVKECEEANNKSSFPSAINYTNDTE